MHRRVGMASAGWHATGCRALAAAMVSWAGTAAEVSAQDRVTSPETLVTATRTEKLVGETPTASYIVDQQGLAARNVPALDAALATLPGVFDRRGKGVTDTLGGISLRGVPDQKRTAVLLDGIPLNDGYAGAVDWSGLAYQDFSRIEVVMGPSSSLYGSNAMGGVVNLVPRTPKGPEFRFSAGYGDAWNNSNAPSEFMRSYVSVGNRSQEGLSLIASLGYTSTDGYPSDLNVQSLQPPATLTGAVATQSTSGAPRYLIGDRGDNHWWDQQIAVRAAYEFNARDVLRVGFLRSGYDYGYDSPRSYLRNAAGQEVFAYAVGASNVREATFLSGSGRSLRDLYSAALDVGIGITRLKVSAGYSSLGTNYFTTPGTGAATTRTGGPGTIAENPVAMTYVDSQLSLPLGKRNLIVAGASYRNDEATLDEFNLSNWRVIESRTGLSFRAGGNLRNLGVFAQDEISVTESITAYLGVRWDQWTSSDGYSQTTGQPLLSFEERTRSHVSPKVGATWRLSPEWLVRASYGEAFRAPNIFELYRTWRSAAGTVFVSNPDLEPETVRSIELGTEGQPWQGGLVRATLFHNRLDDLIFRRSEPGNVRRFVNAGQATVRGVELELRQALPRGFSTFANFTYNDSNVDSNPAAPASEGKRLTQVPMHTWNLGAQYERGSMFANGFVRHVGKRYSVDDNSDVVNHVYGSYDPFTVVDLKGGYRVTRHLTLSVSVDNLLNQEYFAFYRAPGRAYFLELAGQF